MLLQGDVVGEVMTLGALVMSACVVVRSSLKDEVVCWIALDTARRVQSASAPVSTHSGPLPKFDPKLNTLPGPQEPVWKAVGSAEQMRNCPQLDGSGLDNPASDGKQRLASAVEKDQRVHV